MSEEQQKQNLISCCSCQTQLPSENTDSGYHQAECRLSPDESLEVRPLSNRTCKNSGSSNNSITIANKGSISRTMSTRHRRHHNHRYDNPQRPTPWTSTFAGSCSWWSRLVSSSSTSMTSSATSSFFVTLLLLLFSTMLHTAGKLDTSFFALFTTNITILLIRYRQQSFSAGNNTSKTLPFRQLILSRLTGGTSGGIWSALDCSPLEPCALVLYLVNLSFSADHPTRNLPTAASWYVSCRSLWSQSDACSTCHCLLTLTNNSSWPFGSTGSIGAAVSHVPCSRCWSSTSVQQCTSSETDGEVGYPLHLPVAFVSSFWARGQQQPPLGRVVRARSREPLQQLHRRTSGVRMTTRRRSTRFPFRSSVVESQSETVSASNCSELNCALQKMEEEK